MYFDVYKQKIDPYIICSMQYVYKKLILNTPMLKSVCVLCNNSIIVFITIKQTLLCSYMSLKRFLYVIL